MFCNKCGKEFEGQGTLCPECTAEATPVNNESVPPVPVPEETPVTQENQQATPVPQPETVESTEEPFVLGEPEAPRKPKRIGLIAGIAAAVIALAVGAYFLFFHGGDQSPATVNDATSATTAGAQVPAEVQLDTYIDTLTGHYSTVKTAAGPRAMTADVHIQIGDALYGMLESVPDMPSDLRWLNDIQIVYDRNRYNGSTGQAATLRLHGTEIASFRQIRSAEDSSVYYGLPELNSRYLCMQYPEETFGLMLNQASVELMMQHLPAEEVVNRLLKRYVSLVAGQIAGAERIEETVQLGDISEKQYVTTVTITEADIYRILKTLLTQAQTDEDVKAIIDAYSAYVNASLGGNAKEILGQEPDYYSDFTSSVPERLTELDDMIKDAKDENYIMVKVYNNLNGLITGLYATIYTTEEEAPVTVQAQSATADGVSQFVFAFEDMECTGTFRQDGDVATATVIFKQILEDGVSEEVCTMEVTATKGDKTVIKLIPGALMLEGLLEELPIGAMSSALAGSVSATVTIYEFSQSRISAAIDVSFNNNSLVNITAELQQKAAQPIDLPSDPVIFNIMEGEEGLMEWMQDVSIDPLLNNLRTAGAPQEILDALKERFAQAQSETVETDTAVLTPGF